MDARTNLIIEKVALIIYNMYVGKICDVLSCPRKCHACKKDQNSKKSTNTISISRHWAVNYTGTQRFITAFIVLIFFAVVIVPPRNVQN